MHKDIGYLPEQPYFYDYLTARELLDCYARFSITPPPSDESAWSGFSTALDWRPPATYSFESIPKACFKGWGSRRRSCTIPK